MCHCFFSFFFHSFFPSSSLSANDFDFDSGCLYSWHQVEVAEIMDVKQARSFLYRLINQLVATLIIGLKKTNNFPKSLEFLT